MITKSKLLFVFSLTLSHAIFFLAGSMRGSNIRHEQAQHAVEEVNAHISLAHYSSYRDIALDIQAGRYVDAKCQAEMAATSMLLALERCMGIEQCKKGIFETAQQFALELLDGAPVPIEKRSSCSRQIELKK